MYPTRWDELRGIGTLFVHGKQRYLSRVLIEDWVILPSSVGVVSQRSTTLRPFTVAKVIRPNAQQLIAFIESHESIED